MAQASKTSGTPGGLVFGPEQDGQFELKLNFNEDTDPGFTTQFPPNFTPEAYENGPIFRTDLPEGGRDGYAPRTPRELGLTPGDWADPEYRRAYSERLILAETEPEICIIGAGKREFRFFKVFLNRYRDRGIRVLKDYDAARDEMVAEITQEIKRDMQRLRMKVIVAPLHTVQRG